MIFFRKHAVSQTKSIRIMTESPYKVAMAF